MTSRNQRQSSESNNSPFQVGTVRAAVTQLVKRNARTYDATIIHLNSIGLPGTQFFKSKTLPEYFRASGGSGANDVDWTTMKLLPPIGCNTKGPMSEGEAKEEWYSEFSSTNGGCKRGQMKEGPVKALHVQKSEDGGGCHPDMDDDEIAVHKKKM